MARELTFRLARESEIDTIYQMYHALAGRPYCAWDEVYPGCEHVADDIAHGSLFVLCDGDAIVAGGTIRPWPEHDSLADWRSKNPCDLLRIGVSGAVQGQGIGRRLLDCLSREAARQGYDGIRILVASGNVPAERMYEHAGARFRGMAESYGIHWTCSELELRKSDTGCEDQEKS